MGPRPAQMKRVLYMKFLHLHRYCSMEMFILQNQITCFQKLLSAEPPEVEHLYPKNKGSGTIPGRSRRSWTCMCGLSSNKYLHGNKQLVVIKELFPLELFDHNLNCFNGNDHIGEVNEASTRGANRSGAFISKKNKGSGTILVRSGMLSYVWILR